ncbi:TPA: carbamoyl phosphate synthase large subunit, partial [Mannheimia haemolytica]|nr:carbamoyl phosphate synthase large subunit [Mannheimia haemolytica]
GPNRILYVADAFGAGFSLEEVHHYSKIDPWFLVQIQDLVLEELALEKKQFSDLDANEIRRLKRKGFSDKRIAQLTKVSEKMVRDYRHTYAILPVYKRVDTCAAEFASDTAYLYSTYEEECEAKPSDRKKVMILGGGPNRIGQGIEFDYCCVHASLALREAGYET